MNTSPRFWHLVLSVICATVCGSALSAPNLRLISQAHQAAIWSMSLDAKEQLLLSASDDKTAKLWEVPTGKLLRTFVPPAAPGTGRLVGSALSPDGGTIALGGDYKRRNGDYAIYLYKADGTTLPSLSGLPGAIHRLAFSADGRWLAASVRQVGVVIYDTRNWSAVVREQCERCLKGEIGFSNNSAMLAANDDNGDVWTYRLRDGQWSKAGRGSIQPGLSKLAVHPSGKWLAIGTEHDDAVLVLDGDTLAVAHKPVFNLRNVLTRTVAWSTDGGSLYAAGLWYPARGQQPERLIKRWDGEGRGPVQDLRSKNVDSFTTTVLLLRNGSLVAGAVSGDVVRIDPSGREAYVISSELNLSPQRETAANPEILRVAEDGSAIEFRQRTDVLARGFVLAERRWGSRLGTKWSARGLRGANAILEDWVQSTTPRLNGKALELGPGRRVVSYAFSPDGKWLAIGTNRGLQLYDTVTGTRVRLMPMAQAITGLRFFKGGEAIAIQYADGHMTMLRRHDFRRLLDLFLHPNGRDWALYSPRGYFDASPGAEALLGWHVTGADETDGTIHPFSRFAETLHRPDVIDRVLMELKTDRELLGETHTAQVASPADQDAEVVEDVPQDVVSRADRAPQASIEIAPRALEPEARSVTLLVGGKDLGDGIAEVRVFHNGKALAVNWDAARRQAIVRSVLLLGENEFKAIALGRSRIEGLPAIVRVADSPRPEGAQAVTGKLHVVLVAVSNYRNGALNLGYPVKDARALVAALKQPAFRRLHGEPIVHAVYDNDATGVAVRQLFERVRREVQPEDTVVVFAAGHGDVESDEWYFVPHELETPEVPDHLKSRGLSRSFWQQELRNLPARRVLFMIDACKSGGALTRSTEARRALMQLARSSGTYILAATQADQMAWELPNVGHGLFTYAVLESLKAAPSGKQLSVETLITQVKAKMPELAEQNAKVRQIPVSFGLGTDFPLALFE